MRLFKVTVAGKLPIENFSLPVVSACPSWHFQASPLGVQESVLLDCSFSTQHSSVDTESPRDKGIGVFQFSHGSQRSPLKAVAVPRLMDWAFYTNPQTAPMDQRRSLRKNACLHSLLSKG